MTKNVKIAYTLRPVLRPKNYKRYDISATQRPLRYLNNILSKSIDNKTNLELTSDKAPH